jgi:hypothetical protein
MSFDVIIKKQAIRALKDAAQKGAGINIKQLDSLIRGAINTIDKLNSGGSIFANASRRITSSGSDAHGGLTFTITGIPVPVEMMWKIAQAYLRRNEKYYTAKLVDGKNRDREGNLTATGQTRGQFHRRNVKADDNVFTFAFPDEARQGDIKKRKNRAKEKKWKRPADQIQRGKRKGETWRAKQYNEVAYIIEETKDQPIMLEDSQTIKEVVLETLIRGK